MDRHYISMNIGLQELVDQFNKGIAGGHLKYVGYESDKDKQAFSLFIMLINIMLFSRSKVILNNLFSTLT